MTLKYQKRCVEFRQFVPRGRLSFRAKRMMEPKQLDQIFRCLHQEVKDQLDRLEDQQKCEQMKECLL